MPGAMDIVISEPRLQFRDGQLVLHMWCCCGGWRSCRGVGRAGGRSEEGVGGARTLSEVSGVGPGGAVAVPAGIVSLLTEWGVLSPSSEE